MISRYNVHVVVLVDVEEDVDVVVDVLVLDVEEDVDVVVDVLVVTK